MATKPHRYIFWCVKDFVSILKMDAMNAFYKMKTWYTVRMVRSLVVLLKFKLKVIIYKATSLVGNIRNSFESTHVR